MSIVDGLICIPISSIKSSFFTFILVCIYCCCCFLNDSHSDQSVMNSQCSFDQHFPDTKDVGYVYILLAICTSSFKNCSLICTFIDQIVKLFNFKNSLCIYRYQIAVCQLVKIFFLAMLSLHSFNHCFLLHTFILIRLIYMLLYMFVL